VGVLLQLEELAEPAEVLIELVGPLALGFVEQWAAMPYSAVRCMSWVRICTS
jgi:hypothetical protein